MESPKTKGLPYILELKKKTISVTASCQIIKYALPSLLLRLHDFYPGGTLMPVVCTLFECRFQRHSGLILIHGNSPLQSCKLLNG